MNNCVQAATARPFLVAGRKLIRLAKLSAAAVKAGQFAELGLRPGTIKRALATVLTKASTTITMLAILVVGMAVSNIVGFFIIGGALLMVVDVDEGRRAARAAEAEG